MNGAFLAFLAFVIWGLFPLYFRRLSAVPASELVAHRIVWSCALLTTVFTLKRHWMGVYASLRSWRVLGFHVLSAACIGTNWLLYVWAVNHGQVLASSLGYFLNPLLSIVLGVLFFKERLSWMQKIAVCIAAAGIFSMAIMEGIMPWLPLAISLSFGGYGIMKKLTPVPSSHGLWLETLLLAIPGVAGLWLAGQGGDSGWSRADTWHRTLLGFTGVVTVVPTLLFALASTRIPLSTLGFLQFITPTLSFLLGVFL